MKEIPYLIACDVCGVECTSEAQWMEGWSWQSHLVMVEGEYAYYDQGEYRCPECDKPLSYVVNGHYFPRTHAAETVLNPPPKLDGGIVDADGNWIVYGRDGRRMPFESERRWTWEGEAKNPIAEAKWAERHAVCRPENWREEIE